MIFLIALIIIIILLIAFSVGLMCFVIYPKKYTMEETYETEKRKGFLDGTEDIPCEYIDIPSFDGYVLHGTYWPNKGEKYVVITHGYTYTRWGSAKYAKIFYNLGFDVYFYDIRHHGMNEKSFCSMGYNEGRDVAAVVSYFQQKYGKDIIIGLHGESLGAASTLLSLQYCENLSFAVCDCPFTDLNILLEDLGQKMFHLPKAMTHLASIASLVLKGFRLDSIKPIDAASSSSVPLLLVHGKEDDFIYPAHSQRVYDVYKGYKEIFYYDIAKHAQSYEYHPDEYAKMIENFLCNINLD